MNRINVLTIFIISIIANVAIGQFSGFYKTDIGFKLGAANYLGEIGGKEKDRRGFVWDMKVPQTRTSASLFGRHRFNDYFALNAGFNYSSIRGDDNLSTNKGRVGRNLRFKNDILDLTVRGEGYLYKINDVGNRGRYYVSFETYAHAGLNVFYSNPKGSLDGDNWTALRPLMTEGVAYKQIGLGIPVGLGFFFTVKRKHRIGWDLTVVTTFTDYLDDISNVYAEPSEMGSPEAINYANQSANSAIADPQLLPNYFPGEKRGDPTHNDAYLNMNLSYSYVLKGRYNGNISTGKYGRRKGKRKTVRRERVKL